MALQGDLAGICQGTPEDAVGESRQSDSYWQVPLFLAPDRLPTAVGAAAYSCRL